MFLPFVVIFSGSKIKIGDFSGTKLIYDGPDIWWINKIETKTDYYSPGTYTSEGVINYFYSDIEPVFVSRIVRIGESKIFNA